MRTESSFQRARWIDALRGVMILMVMLWHVQVIGDQPTVKQGDLWEASHLLQTMRMPTLFFLSGLFLPKALAKPTIVYVRGKWENLLWPYLVWVVLDTHQSTGQLFVRPSRWSTNNYLWFLLYLMVFFVAAWVMRRLPAWAMASIAAAALAVAWRVAPTDARLIRLLTYGLIFFLGAAASTLVLQAHTGFTWLRVTIVLTAFVILHKAMQRDDLAEVPEADLLVFLFFAMVTVSFAVSLAMMVGSHSVFLPMQWIGQRSIVFYTGHFVVMRAVIFALVPTRFAGIASAWIAFLLALAICTALARWRRYAIVDALFVPPKLTGLRQRTKTRGQIGGALGTTKEGPRRQHY